MSSLSNRHPLDRTSFIQKPLETHAYQPNPKSDFLCAKCNRPRALHAGPEDFIAGDDSKPQSVRVGRR